MIQYSSEVGSVEKKRGGGLTLSPAPPCVQCNNLACLTYLLAMACHMPQTGFARSNQRAPVGAKYLTYFRYSALYCTVLYRIVDCRYPPTKRNIIEQNKKTKKKVVLNKKQKQEGTTDVMDQLATIAGWGRVEQVSQVGYIQSREPQKILYKLQHFCRRVQRNLKKVQLIMT